MGIFDTINQQLADAGVPIDSKAGLEIALAALAAALDKLTTPPASS